MPAFEHQLWIRFHQADPAGVLFYGRLFELVEETYEVFCRAIGMDIDAAMRMEGITTPVVHARVDFRERLSVGAPVVVRLMVARLGDSSFTLDYEFVGDHGRTSASARVVHVAVDASGWRKVTIPDDLRSRLAAYLGPEPGSAGSPPSAAGPGR